MREAYLALADHYRGQLAQAAQHARESRSRRCRSPLRRRPRPHRDRLRDGCSGLAGVELDAIAGGTTRWSDESWAPYNAEWLADARTSTSASDGAGISQPAGRTLVEVLEEIEEREGIRNLLVGAGADEAALDRLVARLREP
jgi:hypothetical protein